MDLSYDELDEIFSRLPAKAIYKFTSLNKFFAEFPKDMYFVLKQAQNAWLRDDTCFLVQTYFPFSTTLYNNQVQLYQLPGEELSSGVSRTILTSFYNCVKILGSSNGLVLCPTTNEDELKFFMTNPTTQSCISIPTPEHMQNQANVYNHKIGFLCDLDDNYMVYHFVHDLFDWSSYFDCHVYYSKEGAWKVKEERFFTGSRSLKFDMPVYHRGAVHFISDCSSYITRNSPFSKPYIMSYNFENGESRKLKIPKEARKGFNDDSCNMKIFKWGKVTDSNQSICLVRLRKQVFTVWTLIEYESSRWRKVLKIRIKAMGLVEKDLFQIMVTHFVVINGDLLVFATEQRFYAYALSDMSIHKIWKHDFERNILKFTPFTDTLRPCGGIGNLPLLM